MVELKLSGALTPPEFGEAGLGGLVYPLVALSCDTVVWGRTAISAFPLCFLCVRPSAGPCSPCWQGAQSLWRHRYVGRLWNCDVVNTILEGSPGHGGEMTAVLPSGREEAI